MTVGHRVRSAAFRGGKNVSAAAAGRETGGVALCGESFPGGLRKGGVRASSAVQRSEPAQVLMRLDENVLVRTASGQ
jgi:hypothetical protein